MDFKQLQALGAFVPPDLTTREIKVKVPDPETGETTENTITVHIRKRSSADFVELVNATENLRPFVMIHRCTVQPDGQPVFETLDQAKSIAEWLLLPLLDAVREVNETVPKSSGRKKNSGANLRSRSAAGQSGSGSTRLQKMSNTSGSHTGTSAAP